VWRNCDLVLPLMLTVLLANAPLKPIRTPSNPTKKGPGSRGAGGLPPTEAWAAATLAEQRLATPSFPMSPLPHNYCLRGRGPDHCLVVVPPHPRGGGGGGTQFSKVVQVASQAEGCGFDPRRERIFDIIEKASRE